MGWGFKDIVKSDNREIFLNFEEFGELHVISGRRKLAIIDDNEMVEREKRQTGPQAWRQGGYVKKRIFYVLAEDFGPLPPVGRSLVFDGRTYLITDSVDEDGIYSISLEAVRA